MDATEELLQRITVDPEVMVGKPVIRGTRITVELILNLLGNGATIEEIIDSYPHISHDDIRACLLFAERVLSDNTFVPLSA